MFTSLLNTVCAYDPVGFGVPYNHLLFTDSLEPLVDVALQILIVTLDYDISWEFNVDESAPGDNLFINYLSRIHRDEGIYIVTNIILDIYNLAPKELELEIIISPLICTLIIFFKHFYFITKIHLQT